MATLREIIDNSNYAVFFGGAGVSTASNIPDFRGKNGIYNTENEWGASARNHYFAHLLHAAHERLLRLLQKVYGISVRRAERRAYRAGKA